METGEKQFGSGTAKHTSECCGDGELSSEFVKFLALPTDPKISRRDTGWTAGNGRLVDKDVWQSRGALGGTHWGVGMTALGEVKMSFAFRSSSLSSGAIGSRLAHKSEQIPTSEGCKSRRQTLGNLGRAASG